MPSPHSEEYRHQVETRIQDLVAGNRPRDPHLSTVSTQRLIMEGVVEEMRIYRLHKEEKAKKEKDTRKREKKSMSGRSGMEKKKEKKHRRGDVEEGGSGRQHHHGDVEIGGHGHHYRHGSRGQRRRGGTEGDRHQRHYHDRSGGKEKHRNHGPCDRSVDQPKSYSQQIAEDIPDLVIEGPSDPNPRFMMTGGAGPAGTLPSTPEPRLRSSSKSRSRYPRPSRADTGPPDANPSLMINGGAGPVCTLPSTSEPRAKSRSKSHDRPRPGRAVVSRSPTRRHGPDGTTPFGQLPKKAAGVGLVVHALTVYKHIKAEHDAGHRSRGVVERTVDGWRGKGKEREKEPEKVKKVKSRRREDERREVERSGRRKEDHYEQRYGGRSRRETDRSARVRDDEHDRRRHRDRGEQKPRHVRRPDQAGRRNKVYVYDRSRPLTTHGPRTLSRHQSPPGNTQLPYHLPPVAPPPLSHDDVYSQEFPPSVHIQAATPPSAHHTEAPAWPPTPENFNPRLRTASPSGRDRSVSCERPISLRSERSSACERFESRLASEISMSRSRSSSPRERGRPASRSRSEHPSPSLSRSRSRSPSYLDSSSDRSISPIQMPAPPENSTIPPPPPPPPPMPRASPNHAALLGQIQGDPPKLRKVRSCDKKDASTAASARRIYEETAHSHDVEERERRQGSSRAWSDVESNVSDGYGDGETEGQRRRKLEMSFGHQFADELEARVRR